MAGRQDDELLRQLHLSEGRLLEAVRISNIGIFDHDHTTDTIYWSSEQRAIYGVGVDEEVTLERFISFVHPDDAKAIGAAVARAHDPSGDGRFDVQHRVIRAGGEVRWVDTRSQTFFADGRPVRTVGAALDTTDRRLAEERIRQQSDALRMSEARFRGLLEATPILAAINRTPKGTIVFVNQALADLVGSSREQIEGRHWRDVCGAFPEDMHWTEELERGNLIAYYEGRARDHRGDVRQIAWSSSFLPAAEGEEPMIASLGIDVTEQRLTEAARARAEDDRARLMEALLTAEETERRRLAEALHDDTVQEITASLLAIDSALRGEPAARALERARSTIAAALERARRLMFEVSPAALESVGLESAITTFCRQIGRDSGIEVDVDAGVGRYPRPVEELCYRTIREAVINTRKHARATRLRVSVREADGQLRGVVEDDGVGFDTATLPSGQATLHLGVQAMADRIRIAHGDFSIRSTPGTGTRVEFGIPARGLAPAAR